MDFADLVKAVATDTYVDAGDWKADWCDGYAVYADLLAFKDKCERSEPSTVNALVRFHRAVLRASTPGVHIYRFTDATFATSPSLWSAIAFAGRVLHFSLAMNPVTLRRQHVVASHLFIPRVTLAGGRLLRVDGPSDHAKAAGIDPRTFIAGTAVIAAYELEREGVAFGLTVSQSLATDLFTFPIRGDQKHSVRRVSEAIRDSLLEGAGSPLWRGKVMEWPWLLSVNDQNDEGTLWADSRVSVKAKLMALCSAADLMGTEFVTQSLHPRTGHHHAGLRRHLYALGALLTSERDGRQGDTTGLRTMLGAIRA